MFVQRVEMGNFTAYTEASLDTAGGIYALVGDNGAGKSSIVDAVLWCLYGEASKGGVRELDNYVRRGAQECRVAVEFSLRGERYRVVRHRSLAKGKTLLEAFQEQGGEWVPVSGHGKADTQQVVLEILGVDYDTLVATTVSLQGRSGLFTGAMGDTARKELLGKVLLLQAWDGWLEQAKADRDTARGRARVLTEQAARAEVKAAERPPVESEIAAEEARLAARAAEVATATEAVAGLEARVRQVPSLQQRVRELQDQVHAREQDRTQVLADAAGDQQEIVTQEALLGRRASIAAQIPDAERAAEVAGELVRRQAAEVAEAEAAAARAAGVDGQVAEVDRDLAARQKDLESIKTDGEKIREQERQARVIAARAEVIRQAAERAQTQRVQLADLDERAARWPALDARLQELRALSSAWAATHTADMRRLEQQVADAEHRADLLEDVPCAGTDLQPRCQLLASAQQAAGQLGDLRLRLQELAGQTDPHAQATQAAIDALEALQYSPEAHVSVRRELASLQDDERQLPLLEAAERQLPELRATLDGLATRYTTIQSEIKTLRARRAELEVIQGTTAAATLRLGDARMRHAAAQADERQCRDRLAQLRAEAAAAAAGEDAARARIGQLQARITQLSARADQLAAEVERLRTEQEAAARALDEAAGLQEQLGATRTALTAARQGEAQAREQIGRLRQALAQVVEAEAQARELRHQVAAAEQEALVCDVLVRACDRRGGVPALVVENAVPAIEQHANDLLRRMLGGRLQVRLDTQAATKAGTTQEVLRVTVVHRGHEAPYVTCSGAEQFCVDLALRIGLSRFLAHRSGAEVGLLVIDEGLAALRPEHRQDAVAAIREAARDYPVTLVVSHLPEIEDSLPQRIEVEYHDTGSTIKVVA